MTYSLTILIYLLVITASLVTNHFSMRNAQTFKLSLAYDIHLNNIVNGIDTLRGKIDELIK